MGSNCCLQLPWECCRSLFSCHAIFFQTESSCCLSKMHLYRNVLETSLASSLDSKYEGIGKLYFLIEQICPFIWHSCEKLFFRPMSVHLCPMGKRFTMGICANKPPEKSGICAENLHEFPRVEVIRLTSCYIWNFRDILNINWLAGYLPLTVGWTESGSPVLIRL